MSDMVTVGFDGSKASLAALRWALSGPRAASKVQVVTSYSPQGSESIDVARMNAEAILHRASTVNAGDVVIDGRAIQGDPTEVLLACSDDSELLVLGRHGTSGIIHSALGSVGDACARLASCPVVIVPPDRH